MPYLPVQNYLLQASYSHTIAETVFQLNFHNPVSGNNNV